MLTWRVSSQKVGKCYRISMQKWRVKASFQNSITSCWYGNHAKLFNTSNLIITLSTKSITVGIQKIIHDYWVNKYNFWTLNQFDG
jgi:hypothetical protein